MTAFTRVLVESPYNSPTAQGLVENRNYLIRAMRDCMDRGETPFASHLLYTQILNDRDKNARVLGLALAKPWYYVVDKAVFYMDKGLSPGMEHGLKICKRIGLTIEERYLNGPDR